MNTSKSNIKLKPNLNSKSNSKTKSKPNSKPKSKPKSNSNNSMNSNKSNHSNPTTHNSASTQHATPLPCILHSDTTLTKKQSKFQPKNGVISGSKTRDSRNLSRKVDKTSDGAGYTGFEQKNKDNKAWEKFRTEVYALNSLCSDFEKLQFLKSLNSTSG
ncbi:hypothetical protein BKA69DRAFT_1035655 [Paraphysoderma sedebokerense]|nr:hypothetical protein BKA69DRAFT_1035655 [Paraphysoderma sedebokerense]